MRNMMTPCKECASRYEACHDTCEKYKEWKKKRDEIKDNEYKKRITEVMLKNDMKYRIKSMRSKSATNKFK